MPTMDEARARYPGWKDADIINAIAKDNGVSPAFVRGYLGYKEPSPGIAIEAVGVGVAIALVATGGALALKRALAPKGGTKSGSPSGYGRSFAAWAAFFAVIASVPSFTSKAFGDALILVGVSVVVFGCIAFWVGWLYGKHLVSSGALAVPEQGIHNLCGVSDNPRGSITVPSTQSAGAPVDENELYRQAGEEVASESFDVATWARAFSDADGDDRKAKARYISLRVEGLKAAKESPSA